MYTIIDYLKYYKDTTIKHLKLNTQDFLLFSLLVYLPLDSFSTPKNFSEFLKYANKYKGRTNNSNTIETTYQILKIIANSRRYQDLKVEDFLQEEDNTTQFGAATFVLGKNKIIAFNGSNHSLISWMENIRILYQYPTTTQEKAIEYLKEKITKNDDNVYVIGHSKGGNLAMVSAMELENNPLKKVKQIYNFDGPGLLKEEYQSKYKKIKHRLITVIPSNSMVGILLHNENYKVIKSKNHLIETHYPSSWCIFGEFFIEENLKVFSNQLHNYTTTTLEKIDRTILSDTIEALFLHLIQENTKDICFETIKEALKKVKDIDPSVFRYLNTLLTSLITVNKKERNKET